MVPMWLKAPKMTENGTPNNNFSVNLSAIRHKLFAPESVFCKTYEFKQSVAESDRNQTKNIIGAWPRNYNPNLDA